MSTVDEVLGVFERSGADDEIGLLVLAALDGPEALEAALSGDASPTPAEQTSEQGSEVENIYLSAIEATGFRGIGPTTRLEVSPGPGLTVVAGRNGSGKSSFADALEVLLTGDSWRWKNKSAEWKQGWRNLHHTDEVRVGAEFLVEGSPGHTRLWREWDDDAKDASDAKTLFQAHGDKLSDLDASGWSEPIALYRPLLSHSELGVIADNPSSLFDALAGVLGVDDLVGAAEHLRRRRLDLQAALKETRKSLKDEIRPALEEFEDPRAVQATEALSGNKWDLDDVEKVASGAEAVPEKVAGLERVAQLKIPDSSFIEGLAVALEECAVSLEVLGSGDAGRSHRSAQLLQLALEEHEEHGEADCPVCGVGRLDGSWREATEKQLQELRLASAAYQEAIAAVGIADADARKAIEDPSLDVPSMGQSVEGYETALEAWRDAPDQPRQLADHVRSRYPPLASEATSVIDAAVAELAELEDVWRPLATTLTSWMHGARRALEDDALAKKVKAAEDALGLAIAEIRSERFAPISQRAIALWETLRLQSNVQLEGVELTGKGNRRRVELQVTVDDTEGAALGVVSQGEVNCLALSLFFPRVMLPESPFRFIVIDDPVQAMDPARVDGLAQVFTEIAQDRQLIVFTHDDRLPASLRRLMLPHTLLQVTRRPGSHVEVRTRLDPVSQYFSDARAVSKDDELPDGVASQVVPGFCRSGIESACMEAIRRRRLVVGESHEDVEDLLSGAGTTQLAALALFDDESAGGKVLGEINRRWNAVAADAFNDCKRGAHKGFSGSLESLVNESQGLAERLRTLT